MRHDHKVTVFIGGNLIKEAADHNGGRFFPNSA